MLLSPPEPGLNAVLAKYWKIFRVSLGERMVYRADFFLSTVLRFLPLLTTILLWHAVFAGMDESSFSGFTLEQMVGYLLLVHIARMFSSMPGLAFGSARHPQRRTEEVPAAANRHAHLPARTASPTRSRTSPCRAHLRPAVLPLPRLHAAVARHTHPAGVPHPLLLAFVIGFHFEACIGMVGFWFLEITSFLYVVNTVNFFVSGQMFPLDILDPNWAWVLKALPFKYLAYFPTMIVLGKVPGDELVQGLLGQAVWAVFFVVLARMLYRLGLRRYSAYGG
jgi:ABC-2 type transport system permease protein